MKKVLFGLFLISSLLCSASAKADPGNQTVQGKQYLVLGGGGRPLADNSIFYRPCNYNNECEEYELSYLKKIGEGTDKIAISNSLSNIMKEFRQSVGLRMVRTDFDGNYSFECPTEKCLVFSDGNAGLANAYWLKTVRSNSKVDLTGSNTIYVWDRRN